MNEYTRRYSTIRAFDRERYNISCPIVRRTIDMNATIRQQKSIKPIPVKSKNRIKPHYRVKVKSGVRVCRKLQQCVSVKLRRSI